VRFQDDIFSCQLFLRLLGKEVKKLSPPLSSLNKPEDRQNALFWFSAVEERKKIDDRFCRGKRRKKVLP